MKFITLHTGTKDTRVKLIVNPWSVAIARQEIASEGLNSIVLAANTAYPVTETVDEIERMINDAVREVAK